MKPLAWVLSLLAFGCAKVHAHPHAAGQGPTATHPGPPAGADRQVRWQRTLEDALAIAAAEGRPIFIAINADGESASERIVRERYRDPEFVALTRPFVCLVASPHRHSPRDHESDGTRIQCPRFGEVTCAEHIALEPVVFDRYLGGERISPRHALVLPTGEKVFDLALIWDLREVDRSLAAFAAKAPPPGPADLPPSLAGDLPKDPRERNERWLALARGRTHRERLAFEEAVRGLGEGDDLAGPLGALEKLGDAGSIEALRVVLAKHRERLRGHLDRLTDLVTALGLRSQVADALWDLLRDPGESAENYWPPPIDLLLLLDRVDGDSRRTRSFLLSHAATGFEGNLPTALGPTLVEMFGEEESRRILEALRAEGGAAQPSHAILGGLADRAARSSPRTPPALDEKELERSLSDAEAVLRGNPDDPSVLAAVGRASLGLARKRLEAGGPAELLLADAETFLARASEKNPGDVPLLLDRARVAFHLGKFEEQERLALAAFSLLPSLPGDPILGLREEFYRRRLGFSRGTSQWKGLDDLRADLSRPPERLDAYRWIGDAAARLLAIRSGGDAAVEGAGLARGLRALLCAAVADGSDATDAVSLASWFGALGRRSEEISVSLQALYRHPESTDLHQVLDNAFADTGRVFEAVPFLRKIATRGSPTSAWYLGRAAFTAAEWHRRGAAPDRAIEAYREAEAVFRLSVKMRADFADSVTHYLAMAALGRGFAHLIADRRPGAADCLVEGLSIVPAVEGVRDGLDREAVDLLDGALEWRESGPSPVDPIELAERLGKAAPADARWIRKVADAELREALRCDGRGDPAEGDRHLGLSVEIARRALAKEDAEESRRTLAQSATISAERLLRRGEADGARPFLAEAAPLLGEAPPGEAGETQTLVALAARLREKLGAPRPVARPGR